MLVVASEDFVPRLRSPTLVVGDPEIPSIHLAVCREIYHLHKSIHCRSVLFIFLYITAPAC